MDEPHWNDIVIVEQHVPSSRICKRLATVSKAASLTIHSSSLVSSTNSEMMNAFVNSPLEIINEQVSADKVQAQTWARPELVLPVCLFTTHVMINWT